VRYIFIFSLILAGCPPNNTNLSIENAFYLGYSKSYSHSGNANVTEALMVIWPENISSYKTQEIRPPKVKILLSQKSEEFYTWDEHVRYSIDVSDTIDGDSKYGEINVTEVVLEIEFLPITEGEELNEEEIKDKIKIAEKEPEHIGLSLMKNSTCFGCHADKTKHTGPSFSEIGERYENTSSNIESLAGSILGGSKGVWGNIEMPSNPDLTILETEGIATFILNQGAKKNNWILPGLEGTFRIIQKPENEVKGLYVLTASYTSTSKMRGQHSIILNIR